MYMQQVSTFVSTYSPTYFTLGVFDAQVVSDMVERTAVIKVQITSIAGKRSV